MYFLRKEKPKKLIRTKETPTNRIVENLNVYSSSPGKELLLSLYFIFLIIFSKLIKCNLITNKTAANSFDQFARFWAAELFIRVCVNVNVTKEKLKQPLQVFR